MEPLNDEKIKEIVKHMINKVARIEIDKITDMISLKDELLIDSLLAVQIVALLEEKFQIQIEEVEILNVDTVLELVELIKEYLNQRK